MTLLRSQSSRSVLGSARRASRQDSGGDLCRMWRKCGGLEFLFDSLPTIPNFTVGVDPSAPSVALPLLRDG